MSAKTQRQTENNNPIGPAEGSSSDSQSYKYFLSAYSKKQKPLRTGMIVLTVSVMLFGGLFLSLNSDSLAKTPDFVTICHAAGREGTDKFVTLTLPRTAVYGQAGHFGENGTMRAGHEEDYVGSCKTPSPKPSSSPTPKPSPSSKPTGSPCPKPSPSPSLSPSPKPSPKPTTSPTPSPTPTPVVSPSPTPVVISQSQSQSQTQNNNQTVNITIGGAVAGVKAPLIAPETGVSVLGLTSMFGAGPVGFLLTKFGRGKIIKGKKEENLSRLAEDLVKGRGKR